MTHSEKPHSELDPKPAGTVDLTAAIELGHQPDEVSRQGIYVFLAFLATSLVLVILAMGWMFNTMLFRLEKADPPTSPLANERTPPPAPHLQVVPQAELRTMRAAEDARLESTGWISREQGIARIPIERAMEIVAERGLPNWPPVVAPQPPTGGEKTPNSKQPAAPKDPAGPEQPSDSNTSAEPKAARDPQ